MVRASDLVNARLYKTEDEVIQDALRHLLRARADVRIALAVYRYEVEGLSLARAASLAGVSWTQMKDILLEQHVQPHLGPATLDEAQQEVRTLRTYFQAHP